MRQPKPSPYVGVGIYSVPEAARLVGVEYQKLRRWIGDEHGHAAVIHRQFPSEGIVTFMELMAGISNAPLSATSHVISPLKPP